MRSSLHSRWYWFGLVTLLVALYLLIRLSSLPATTTTDEPFWLGRSANFFSALWHGRFEDTFQHAHPGVTTMWAGMVGYLVAAPDYARMFDTNLGFPYDIHNRIREMGLSEMDVLNASRTVKVALQAALFALSLRYLRRMFGEEVAITAGLLIALDPFLIAHDRLLHIDGLLAITSFAAVLALADAAAFRREATAPWIAAGALAAVAWLTRSTAVVLIPVAFVAAFYPVASAWRVGAVSRAIRPAAVRFAWWLGSAIVVTIALWPALWVSPRTALGFMIEWSENAAASGHELPTWFRGEIHFGDPGPLFYPVSILWRETPVGMLGLALFAGLVLAGPLRRRAHPAARQAIAVVALFAGLYLAGMTLGAKKFDRYILPVYPVLDLVAAIGIVGALRLLVHWRPSRPSWLVPATLGAVMAAQVASGFAAMPHWLDAWNPLLGGGTSAEQVMQTGWGEGLDEAGRFIIADAGIAPGEAVDSPPVIRVSGGRGPLLYALPEPYLVKASGFATADDWYETSYYVGSIQQWQRNISGDVLGYLREFEPAHTVWIGGVRYVDVWNLDDIPAPPWLTGSDACRWTFASQLRLEAIEIHEREATFWFQTLTPVELPEEVIVEIRLAQRPGVPAPPIDATWTGTLKPLRASGVFSGVTLGIDLPPGSDIGDYFIELTVIDAASGAPLPAYPPGNDEEAQSHAIVWSRCGDE